MSFLDKTKSQLGKNSKKEMNFETLFDLILPYDAMVVTVDYNGQLDILQGREIYSFVMPKVR